MNPNPTEGKKQNQSDHTTESSKGSRTGAG